RRPGRRPAPQRPRPQAREAGRAARPQRPLPHGRRPSQVLRLGSWRTFHRATRHTRGRMTGIANAARRLVSAAMLFAALATAHAAAAGPQPHVSGSRIVRDLAAGKTVSASGVVVDGPLEITKHI